MIGVSLSEVHHRGSMYELLRVSFERLQSGGFRPQKGHFLGLPETSICPEACCSESPGQSIC